MKTYLILIILLIIALIVENPLYVQARCIVDKYGHVLGPCSAPTNPRIMDSFGNAITGTVKSGQQIQITADLTNGQDRDQSFAYLVQIQDANGVTVSLSWITGMLTAGQSLNPAQSWIPAASGTYTAQVFFWQSLNNPNPIQPPISILISVM
ncbi:MAG: hypothetical protein AUG16_02685 [Thaumarchaeota archaeon 13_1_20CM_2_39_20]|nr:MAG: hypothetical protein AUG16_02685 [Thaumarchaeota archaeon 13_1_20CM_2_39_20]